MKTEDFALPARLGGTQDLARYDAMRKAALERMAELDSQKAALALVDIFRKHCDLEVFCVFSVSVYNDEGYHEEMRAMSNCGDNLDPDDGEENDLLDPARRYRGEGQNASLHSDLSRWARALPSSAFERLSKVRIRKMEGDLTDNVMRQVLGADVYARWQAGAIDERMGLSEPRPAGPKAL